MSEIGLQAGFVKVKVTPPMGINVPGYFHKRFSDGFLTDLYLRATAFACGETKAIIFSCDAIGIKADAFAIIRDKIATRCNIPADAVYITCTHSHTSYRITVPTAANNDDDIFMHRLFQQFADCAQFAFEDLKPCSLRIATGNAPGIGFIRRYRMKDGTCKTNPATGNPNIVDFDGKQDDSVQLVRVVREDAKEILLVNFGTHADVIGGTKYCYDWPGYLADNLIGAFGGDVEAMLLLGAEGDSNHVNRFLPKGTATKGVHYAKRMARILAGEVLKIYDSAEDVVSDKITFLVKDVKIGKNPYDPADVPEAQEIREMYLKVGKEETEKMGFKLNVPEALRILANLNRPEFFELRVYGLQIGDVAFVGFPGEIFTSIGMSVKESSKMPMTVVTACTNGGEGYFPDAAAFAEAGYERSNSPFAHNCAEILIDAGNELTAQMKIG